MDIEMSLTDQEFDQIEPYIDCRDWLNFMDGEFLFLDCTPRMIVMITLMGLEFYPREQGANK